MTEIVRRQKDVAALLILLAIALAVYFPVLLPGHTLLPTDLLLITPPWEQSSPILEPGFTHVVRRTWDPLFQVYPERKFLGESLRQGYIPLWNPHIFSGTPFAADGQSAVFYPIDWLFSLLPIPFAFGFVAFLHSFLTAAFFYGYSRRIAVTKVGSLGGAIIWMLCGIQVGWQMWQVVDSTLCWLPLGLYFWEGLRQSGRISQGVGFSLAIAMTVLAGHLQFSFYVLLVLGTYAFYRPIALAGKYLRSLALLAAFGALGLLLSCVQPLATADLLRLTIRASSPIAQLLPSALPPAQLGLLVMPELFGGERDYIHHTFLAGDYYEKIVFFGASSLVFALFGLRLRKKGDLSRYWLAVIIFSLLLGCGTPLYNLFYSFVPLYKSFHGLSRVFVMADFAAAALAAQGITLLSTELLKNHKRAIQAVGGTAVLLIILGYRFALLGNGSLISYYLTHEWLQYGLIQLVHAVLFASAAIVVLSLPGPKYAWLAVPIIGAEMLTFAIGLNPGGLTAPLYPQTSETAIVSNSILKSPDDRVLCLSDGNSTRPQSRIVPNGAMSLGWNDASGSDPLILSRYYSFLTLVNLAQSGQPEPAGQGMIADEGSPALNYLNVRWIVSPRTLDNSSYVLDASGAVNVYRNKEASGFAWLVSKWGAGDRDSGFDRQQKLLSESPEYIVDGEPASFNNSGPQVVSPVTESRVGPDQFTISTSSQKPSLLVISQTSCPGWIMKDVGPSNHGNVETVLSPVTVDDLLIGAVLSQGAHRLHFAYRPMSICMGLYGISLGWLIVGVLFGSTCYKKLSPKFRPDS